MSRTTRNRLKSVEKFQREQEAVAVGRSNVFGNLSGIIDAEDSDEESNRQQEMPKSKKRRIIDSEDDDSA